jgi:hypothetical protein
LAKLFQRRRFLEICQSKTRIACGSHVLKDWDKMCNLYRGPSIDASYQFSVHLAKGFQRRRLKCEKLTDGRWQKLTLPLARELKKKKHLISIR